MKKLKNLAFGKAIPEKYTTFTFDEERKIIQLESVSVFNENGLHLGKSRKVITHIVYAHHAEEIADWFKRASEKMSELVTKNKR